MQSGDQRTCTEPKASTTTFVTAAQHAMAYGKLVKVIQPAAAHAMAKELACRAMHKFKMACMWWIRLVQWQVPARVRSLSDAQVLSDAHMRTLCVFCLQAVFASPTTHTFSGSCNRSDTQMLLCVSCLTAGASSSCAHDQC